MTFPRWWCGRDGERWFRGDPKIVAEQAREVAAIIERGVSEKDFTNDSELFRGEWQFGTYQMGALGLLNVCREHPEFRAELLPFVEQAIDEMISKRVRDFDTLRWGEDPLESLDGPSSHAAYLGYLNVVLAVHRQLIPSSRFAALNDRITGALVRRLRNSSQGILETYPGEAYPVDNAGIVASIILHQRTTGADHQAVIARALADYRKRWTDPVTGLLFQSIASNSGMPIGGPRASGTTLAAFLLAYGDPVIAGELSRAVNRELAGSWLGFGYVREYPAGTQASHGDVDSGPVILGISPSGTGFSLAGSRLTGDHDHFIGVYRTAHLLGTPVYHNDRRFFVTGGPIGNAIMLAMLTTPRALP